MENQNLLELLDIYAAMIEKQNETIASLTEILKKQATEIEQLRMLANLEELK